MAPSGLTDEQLAAWRGLLQAYTALTGKLEHEMNASHGLALTWYDVLLNLHEAGGRLRMRELAGSVLISKSGLTRVVDKMVSAGYVDREHCEGDRRGLIAVLTPQGLAVLRRAAPQHLRGVEEHFAKHISDEEAAVLRVVFERLVDESGCATIIRDEDNGEGNPE